MLIPYFISQYDKAQIDKEKAAIDADPTLKSTYITLASQNVTVIQAGANAKAFRHFLDFLGIPTLIITDIDTVKAKLTSKGVRYQACATNDPQACSTSNSTIKYYLNAPEYKSGDIECNNWFQSTLAHSANCISSCVYIAYQQDEESFYARSFEDAFVNVNLPQIKTHLGEISGLKNEEEFDSCSDIYQLVTQVIDKKSDFASSLLFLTHVKGLKWRIPSYIWEGLEWLQKQ